MLARQAATRGDRLALRYKAHGIWHRVTWRQYGDAVDKVAAALLAFGLHPRRTSPSSATTVRSGSTATSASRPPAA
ncbi:MAG TPA: hypothetical protein VGD07_20325 [Methylomirabilota bacterium]|jgi:long-chain acyl-CoA synthetase